MRKASARISERERRNRSSRPLSPSPDSTANQHGHWSGCDGNKWSPADQPSQPRLIAWLGPLSDGQIASYIHPTSLHPGKQTSHRPLILLIFHEPIPARSTTSARGRPRRLCPRGRLLAGARCSLRKGGGGRAGGGRTDEDKIRKENNRAIKKAESQIGRAHV